MGLKTTYHHLFESERYMLNLCTPKMLVYNVPIFSKINPNTLGLEVFGPLFYAELEKVFGDPSTAAHK